MPVVLTTQEAEIRRTVVQSLEKNPTQKRAGGVGQSVGPEFKPHCCKKKKKKRTFHCP
jgi:hypothetical protein